MRVLLVVYDNDSYTSWFPQGLAYIASALIKAGHEVEVFDQAINHYPSSALTSKLNESDYDVVATGMCGGYFQYKKLLEISDAINSHKRAIWDKPYYIIGGHLVSPDPVYFLNETGANAIVIGEGEETIVELVDALKGYKLLKDIKGIAYATPCYTYVNERRPLIKDIDSISLPAYHLFDINRYKLLRMPNCTSTDFVMPVLSGRGCTFKCSFCYRMDTGFRPRSSESIINEIKMLQRTYGITYIAFSDELLMSSTQRTISLCKAFIDAKLNIKWDCNGRLNYATPEVLKLMKEAGCVFINYGIESVDDTVLKNMNKNLTVDQITKGVENTLDAGISPGLNIIWGNIGDTKETLMKGVEFLLKYSDKSQMRTIRPVTPYPGSQLYYYSLEANLIRDIEDFYENKHINSDLLSVNFTNYTNDQFHELLYNANSILIKDFFKNKYKASVDDAKNLYLNRNKDFRGFRQS